MNGNLTGVLHGEHSRLMVAKSKRYHLNCKSKNVIYLVNCNKCSVQYVGSTSNEFKVRFRNHKSTMLTKKDTCEVAFISTKKNMSFLTLNSSLLNKSAI